VKYDITVRRLVLAFTFDDTRRTFMRQIAQLGLTAGAASLGATSVYASEPTNCTGPAHGAAVAFTAGSNPILPRLPASTLGAADVDKLRKGTSTAISAAAA
jgi:hypothetical protein